MRDVYNLQRDLHLIYQYAIQLLKWINMWREMIIRCKKAFTDCSSCKKITLNHETREPHITDSYLVLLLPLTHPSPSQILHSIQVHLHLVHLKLDRQISQLHLCITGINTEGNYPFVMHLCTSVSLCLVHLKNVLLTKTSPGICPEYTHIVTCTHTGRLQTHTSYTENALTPVHCSFQFYLVLFWKTFQSMVLVFIHNSFIFGSQG